MGEFWLFGGVLDYFSDDSPLVRGVARVDGHCQNSFLAFQQLRTLVEPVVGLTQLPHRFDPNLQDGNALSCEVGLIDQDVSLEED